MDRSLRMITAMYDRVTTRQVHRGRLLTVQVLSFTDPQGRLIEREVVRHPGAVLIVPWLKENRLVLLRNQRLVVNECLWELPAGTLEPGEEPAEAARRELAQETGYQAGTIFKLGEFYTSPGFCDELIKVFVARDLRFVGQQLDEGEEIEVRVMEQAQALAMVDDGRIRDAKTIAGLLMWARLPSGTVA